MYTLSDSKRRKAQAVCIGCKNFLRVCASEYQLTLASVCLLDVGCNTKPLLRSYFFQAFKSLYYLLS